ncbi:hypothetical protein P171DRAFT_69638 [Karstenula rhodostoma CBS 690.94]|uniref:Uncharacterized protein n=1 Tax=Karstenula rhodostoma CBS 690.94 TaxID=1392251 RepID=A0A9P4PEP0_9PLEO|nr:hypothetical protein P171DRAFT_69638 [Karstenula rhodostoma CBS 690.94]
MPRFAFENKNTREDRVMGVVKPVPKSRPALAMFLLHPAPKRPPKKKTSLIAYYAYTPQPSIKTPLPLPLPISTSHLSWRSFSLSRLVPRNTTSHPTPALAKRNPSITYHDRTQNRMSRVQKSPFLLLNVLHRTLPCHHSMGFVAYLQSKSMQNRTRAYAVLSVRGPKPRIFQNDGVRAVLVLVLYSKGQCDWPCCPAAADTSPNLMYR